MTNFHGNEAKKKFEKKNQNGRLKKTEFELMSDSLISHKLCVRIDGTQFLLL